MADGGELGAAVVVTDVVCNCLAAVKLMLLLSVGGLFRRWWCWYRCRMFLRGGGEDGGFAGCGGFDSAVVVTESS